MIINELLYEKKMSMYTLSKKSGVPNSTIRDLCNGKTELGKCTVDNLRKISIALEISMDELMDRNDRLKRVKFDTFRNEVQHDLKSVGDIEYIKYLLISDIIQEKFDDHKYSEALYLLALLDYLSRMHNIPYCTKYNSLRKHKLKTLVYPSSINMMAIVMKQDSIREEAVKNSIPEFIRFNIVECEVGNVV